jgi:hypothetical protein
MNRRPEDSAERFFLGNAESYDHIARVSTLGLDGWWKRKILKKIPKTADRILEQASGAGILTCKIARLFPKCRIIGQHCQKQGPLSLGENLLVEAAAGHRRSSDVSDCPSNQSDLNDRLPIGFCLMLAVAPAFAGPTVEQRVVIWADGSGATTAKAAATHPRPLMSGRFVQSAMPDDSWHRTPGLTRACTHKSCAGGISAFGGKADAFPCSQYVR